MVFASVPEGASPWIYVAAAVGFIPLLWRSSAPIPVFFAELFFALAAVSAFPDLRPTLGLLVASYTVAANANRKTSILLASLAIPAFLGMSLQYELQQHSEDPPSVIVIIGVVTALLGTAPWIFGRLVRASRRKLRDVETAGRRAAERARVEERQQIALELHDIISHSVSVMVLQADGARAVLSNDPAAAGEALEHIAQVGRSSFGELRRLLGVLADGALDSSDVALRGLSDLPAVVEEAERSGLHVGFDVTGRAQPVPASFERTVHRIVKECLSNAYKHGGPGSHASVGLFWSEALLVVNVFSDGEGPGDPELSTGHGLAGLRERVKTTEGRIEAGPAPGGHGYVVTATLPIPSSMPDSADAA
ncbi:MAG TPA: histidine kinase [Microlunatus sp.]